jgi:hypothetical protein
MAVAWLGGKYEETWEMSKIKKTIALTSVLVLAFGCGAPTGTQAETKSKPEAKTTSAPVPAKATPAKEAPAKPAPPAAAPAKAKPVEPEVPVFKAWDFTKLEPDKWDGVRFPGNVKVKWPNGAAFTLWETGIGPEFLSLDVNATDFTTIRIELSATRTSDGKNKKPVAIEGVTALWASGQEAKGKHPYMGTRAARLQPSNSENPTVWTAKISTVKTWKGKIARLGFGLDLPEPLKQGGDDRYLVSVKKIELIK